MPSAANLNLYRGWKSCVGWHFDDEPLFGKCGDAKLIVSVSLGNFAVFRWRRQSCPSDEGSCRLDHGDILVMDGQCQDEFFHRTSPGRDQERITLRSVGSNSMSPLVFCLRQGWHVVCQRVRVHPFLLWGIFLLAFLFFFWFLLGVLCIWGLLAWLVSLLCTRFGLLRRAFCWTRPLGGGWWEHYLCNLWGEYLKIHKLPTCIFGYIGDL